MLFNVPAEQQMPSCRTARRHRLERLILACKSRYIKLFKCTAKQVLYCSAQPELQQTVLTLIHCWFRLYSTIACCAEGGNCDRRRRRLEVRKHNTYCLNITTQPEKTSTVTPKPRLSTTQKHVRLAS